MKRIVRAAAAALALAAVPVGRAQTTPPVFTAVDSVAVGSMGTDTLTLTVLGVVQGESAPRSVRVDFTGVAKANAEPCRRMALLAMSKPGLYTFYPYAGGCTLSRATP